MSNTESQIESGADGLARRAPRAGDRLIDDIRKAIENRDLQPGDRLAPIRQLAEQYGISYSSARLALGRLEREGLVLRQHGSQSVIADAAPAAATPHAAAPAGAASPGGQPIAASPARTATVALMLDAGSHVSGVLAENLLHRLQSAGYQPLPVTRDPDAGLEQFAPLLAQWRHDPPHAIVAGWSLPEIDEAIYDACGERTRLIRTASRPRPTAGRWHAVRVDEQHLAELVADYFLQRGHERIGHLTHRRVQHPDRPAWYSRKRYTGHTSQILALGEALQKRGKRHALTIQYQDNIERDGFGPRKLDELRRWLSRDDRPTAVFAQDNRIATVIRAASDLGMRLGHENDPGDLDLLGLGNTPWSRHFGFSSLSVQEPELARRITRLIDAPEADIGDAAINITVPPKLILR